MKRLKTNFGRELQTRIKTASEPFEYGTSKFETAVELFELFEEAEKPNKHTYAESVFEKKRLCKLYFAISKAERPLRTEVVIFDVAKVAKRSGQQQQKKQIFD